MILPFNEVDYSSGGISEQFVSFHDKKDEVYRE